MVDENDILDAADWWLGECEGDEHAEAMVLGFAADLLGLSVKQVKEALQ